MTDTTTTQDGAKQFTGTVVSDKMTDTIVVRVDRYTAHPKYLKYIRRSKKHHAHDPGNKFSEGDRVVIEETRPISKKKRFKVVGSM